MPNRVHQDSNAQSASPDESGQKKKQKPSLSSTTKKQSPIMPATSPRIGDLLEEKNHHSPSSGGGESPMISSATKRQRSEGAGGKKEKSSKKVKKSDEGKEGLEYSDNITAACEATNQALRETTLLAETASLRHAALRTAAPLSAGIPVAAPWLRVVDYNNSLSVDPVQDDLNDALRLRSILLEQEQIRLRQRLMLEHSLAMQAASLSDRTTGLLATATQPPDALSILLAARRQREQQLWGLDPTALAAANLRAREQTYHPQQSQQEEHVENVRRWLFLQGLGPPPPPPKP